MALEKRELAELYPSMDSYTSPVKKPERPIIGREKEMRQVLAAMMRPELCNVILLAEAGTGKTALVQGTMQKDTARTYLEIDLSRMIANVSDPNEMASRLKDLFSEVARFVAREKREVVLFMDEFHQIVQLSEAAVEAMKPLLADSGTRGIRIIAATTYEEFRKWVSPNQPLVERLQRINLAPPGEEMTIQILRNMAERYGVSGTFYNDNLFHLIYEYTNRYIPASNQPRKSIRMLDAMIGWNRAENRRLDSRLLADVIYESEGVNVAFRVDAGSIEKELNRHVFAQEYATQVIAQRLQVCVADLNNNEKPMSSFLFTGSTGVGKGCWDEEPIPVYTKDGSVCVKRNGSLEIGDYVFNRKGEPVQVTGVYHRGLKQCYQVTLGDGRQVIVDGSHLWTWKYAKAHESETWVTTNTEDLIRRGLYRREKGGKEVSRIWIPMNEAVQYSEREYPVDPYVLGALLGNGSLTVAPLTISSGNDFVPKKICGKIGAMGVKQNGRNFDWSFIKEQTEGSRGGIRNSFYQTKDVLSDVSELIGLKSHEKFIPEEYKYGSIEQRWELIRGLFDTDGHIGQHDGDRYNVSYTTTSKRLADDIRDVLFSLGVSSTLSNYGDRDRDGDVHDELRIRVKVENARKVKFFSYPKKLALAEKSLSVKKSRVKDFSMIPIVSIEPLDEMLPTTCIMVEDDEHLYQAGPYIVTHNTEVTKQLAKILFDDARNLHRFDMTEFANPDSLNRFRSELTARVWERPYSIILFDEVEKACAEVTRVLLQVLDDGRLTDDNNREVSFLNAYIVMTTNAGSEIYKTISQYRSSDQGSFDIAKEYNKLIRRSISETTGDNRFPPELLGRIDCIVPFQPLSLQTMRRIAENKLKGLMRTVREKHNTELSIAQRVVTYLVDENLDTQSDSGGARVIVSKLESEVTVKVAAFINNNPDVSRIRVDVMGEMACENTSKRVSDATISVKAMI